MKCRWLGFTLMELMVVVSIIAILALLSVPGFQDQIVRDQITKALPLTDIATQPISAWWAARHSFPRDNSSIGLPPADLVVNNYISSVMVVEGAVHVTFGNRAHGQIKGKTLTLRPAVVDDAPIVPVTWVCGYAEAPEVMTIKGENRTNVPASFLPFICRARGKRTGR
jgi:type IV pilus assembly protein PilA